MKKALIMIIIFFGLAIAGFAIIIIMNYQAHLNSTIKLNDKVAVEKEIIFDDFNPIPGNSESFIYKVTSKYNKNFKFTFIFDKLKSNGLEEYIYVDIGFGDNIYNYKLSDLFIKKEVSLLEKFLKGDEKYLKIKIYMPVSVGNEAKGMMCDFNILIRSEAENE